MATTTLYDRLHQEIVIVVIYLFGNFQDAAQSIKEWTRTTIQKIIWMKNCEIYWLTLYSKQCLRHFHTCRSKQNKKYYQHFNSYRFFLKFGDGIRRLISISLTERIKFDILLGQIFEYKQFFNKLFQQFCGGLTINFLKRISQCQIISCSLKELFLTFFLTYTLKMAALITPRGISFGFIALHHRLLKMLS